MHAHSCFDRCAETVASAVLIASLLLLVPLAPAAADAAPTCSTLPRPQDSVWLVSCRGLGCPIEKQVEKLAYWRYHLKQGWVRSSLAELVATDDPQQVTTFFFHGNRIFFAEAFTKGWSAYRTLVAGADDRPVRFIIWSWPSEPIRGLIQDARIKAGRTDPCAYCLAWLLDQLNPEVPVSLWAHSFGARIVTGALHLLGGGSNGRNRLDARTHSTRRPVNAVLLVAAIDSDWLLGGHRHGRALSQTSEMLLVNNGCDALLKRYRLLYCGGCAQAVGYTGLATWYLPVADRAKVSQIDACCQIGRRHMFAGYLSSPDLMARMRPYLLFQRGTLVRSQQTASAQATDAQAPLP